MAPVNLIAKFLGMYKSSEYSALSIISFLPLATALSGNFTHIKSKIRKGCEGNSKHAK